MFFTLFLITLIFHIFFCAIKDKTLLTPFGVYGIIWFLLLTLTQTSIINYDTFSNTTVCIIYLAYFSFLLSSLFYNQKKFNIVLNNTTKDLNMKKLKNIGICFLGLYLIMAIIYAALIINFFGGISEIFAAPYTTREKFLEADIIPLYISYPMSSGYVVAGIFSFLLFFNKNKLRDVILYLLPLLIVICTDLLSFSRMNILFYIIIYFSSFCLKYISLNKSRKVKYLKILVVGAIMALIVLIVPKLFRNSGDYSTDIYWEYSNIKSINKFTGSFLHLYAYATGPMAAFNKFVLDLPNELLWGRASFAPIYNVLGRIFSIKISNFSILYSSVSVPFKTNIYTYLKEAYLDFGICGVIVFPLVWGALMSCCSNIKVKNNYIKIVVFQYIYLYIIFGIFYTPYSQGGPALGMFIYMLIIILFGNKIKKTVRNNKEIKQ